MKKILFLLALVPLFCLAEPVTLDMATRAANKWVSEKHITDESGSPVTNVYPVIVGSHTNCFVAERSDGGAILLNPDTNLNPIMFVTRIFSNNNESPLMKMIHSTSSTNSVIPSSVKNRRKWNQLLSTNEKKLLMATPTTDDSAYIIDGYESRIVPLQYGYQDFFIGKYKHWGQNGPYLYRNYFHWNSDSGFHSNRDIRAYDYYMYSGHDYWFTNIPISASRPIDSARYYYHYAYGNNSEGLSCVNNTYIPCGCASTALSSIMQCLGFPGYVPEKFDDKYTWTYTLPGDLYYYGNLKTKTTKVIPGYYNWKSLPVADYFHETWWYQYPKDDYYHYFGGLSTSNLNDCCKYELLGRITFNNGVLLKMNWNKSGSGAFLQDSFKSQYGFIARHDSGSICSCSAYYDLKGHEWTPNNETAGSFFLYFPFRLSGNNYTFFTGESSQITLADFLASYIKAGQPLWTHIVSSDYSYAHSVVFCGHAVDSGEEKVYVFMGWQGEDDGWASVEDLGISNYSHLYGVSVIAGKAYETIPFHARITYPDGSPAANRAIRKFRSDYPDEYVMTDTNGYVRTMFPAAFDSNPNNSKNYHMVFGISTDVDSVTITNDTTKINSFPVCCTTRPSYRNTWNLTMSKNEKKNGMKYGTPDRPESLMNRRAVYKPIVVVCGDDGITNSVFKAICDGITDIESKADIYFKDRTEEDFSDFQVGVFDPQKKNNSKSFWSPENGRLSYSTFTNRFDILNTVRIGIDKYYKSVDE